MRVVTSQVAILCRSSLCPFSTYTVSCCLLPLINLQPFNLTFSFPAHAHPWPYCHCSAPQFPSSFFVFFCCFFNFFLFTVSDPGNQLCHGAELGLAGGFWRRRQHWHHAWQLLRYCRVHVRICLFSLTCLIMFSVYIHHLSLRHIFFKSLLKA